jgi:hypothetical protein
MSAESLFQLLCQDRSSAFERRTAGVGVGLFLWSVNQIGTAPASATPAATNRTSVLVILGMRRKMQR